MKSQELSFLSCSTVEKWCDPSQVSWPFSTSARSSAKKGISFIHSKICIDLPLRQACSCPEDALVNKKKQGSSSMLVYIRASGIYNLDHVQNILRAQSQCSTISKDSNLCDRRRWQAFWFSLVQQLWFVAIFLAFAIRGHASELGNIYTQPWSRKPKGMSVFFISLTNHSPHKFLCSSECTKLALQRSMRRRYPETCLF